MFVKDLKDGQVFENIAIELEKITNVEHPLDKVEKRFDFNDLDKNLKYEVKSDKRTYYTENICIEYECNNKDSGITSTESDFYYYFVRKMINQETPDEYKYVRCYKIPTQFIRDYITKRISYIKRVKGGDGFRARLYLINESVFFKFLI